MLGGVGVKRGDLASVHYYNAKRRKRKLTLLVRQGHKYPCLGALNSDLNVAFAYLFTVHMRFD